MSPSPWQTLSAPTSRPAEHVRAESVVPEPALERPGPAPRRGRIVPRSTTAAAFCPSLRCRSASVTPRAPPPARPPANQPARSRRARGSSRPRRCRWTSRSMRMNAPVARFSAYASKISGRAAVSVTRPMSLSPSEPRGVALQGRHVHPLVDRAHLGRDELGAVLEQVRRAEAERRLVHPHDHRLDGARHGGEQSRFRRHDPGGLGGSGPPEPGSVGEHVAAADVDLVRRASPSPASGARPPPGRRRGSRCARPCSRAARAGSSTRRPCG